MAHTSAGWCILRTSGGRTLKLADWLAAAGYRVWTPREMQFRRAGRNRDREEREVPILPSFVFASADSLLELAALRTSPVSQHPPFSIFRYAGRVPILADRAMISLRSAEERSSLLRKPKAERPVVPVGSEVRMREGPFAGMTGVVTDSSGKATRVRFSLFGIMSEVEIASWRLLADGVRDASPDQGTAA